MTWIGVTDRHGGWFSVDGRPGGEGAESVPAGALLPSGTLMVETRLSPEGRPRTLLEFRRSHPWPGSFSLRTLPGGSIALVEEQGGDVRHAVLPCPFHDRTDIVRICYAWNAPARTGRLTVERPESEAVLSVDLKDSRPMVLDDLREIMIHPVRRTMDETVIFAALSDRIEPVGPMPGLTPHTPVLTQAGERLVHRMRRGDVVVTDQGDLVPVLQVIRRTVPAKGSFHPIRIRAPYFGLHRDIVLAPYQRLVIGGSQVEYTFGREAVLAPARHLMDEVSAFRAKGPEMVTFYQLLLPGHEAILAGGCAVESLYVGRLRRKRELLAASLLAPFDRAYLPEHAQPVWPVLKQFEATTLAANRRA